MPERYHIHTVPTPARFRRVGKFGTEDWREDCSSCHNCVKRSCVYGLYRDEADTLRTEIGYLDYIYQCKGCLNCIQSCTKAILTRVENPEFRQQLLLTEAHAAGQLRPDRAGGGAGWGGP